LQRAAPPAFIHVVDAASLALIVPILQRGLRDRSSEVKKTAAQITGNMYAPPERDARRLGRRFC